MNICVLADTIKSFKEWALSYDLNYFNIRAFAQSGKINFYCVVNKEQLYGMEFAGFIDLRDNKIHDELYQIMLPQIRNG